MRSLNSTNGAGLFWRRVLWALALSAFLYITTGCSTWSTKPVTDVQTKSQKLPTKTVKFTLKDGAIMVMYVTEVDYPFVRGVPPEKARSSINHMDNSDPGGVQEYVPPETTDIVMPSSLEVDCRDVIKMEIRKSNTAGSIIVIAMAATVFVIIAAAASSSGGSSYTPSSSSSESSCPVLYMERDGIRHLIGEPYAGAAVKSLQREDLLPVSGLDAGRVQLVMTNEARETQYTDFAELVIADHAPGLRAVATHDQQILLVGDSHPPLKAVDTSGDEVTSRFLAQDEMIWQTDLTPLMDKEEPNLTEEVVFTFARPQSGEQPVLELNLSNTYWLDFIMNRFFALMGDQFDQGMERASRDEMRTLISQWKQREGVELKVEYLAADGWQDVGFVNSVGPLALRQVAVPLPVEQPGEAGETLTIRVTGGAGFWKIDQAALSLADSGKPSLQAVPPVLVRNGEGKDESAQLAGVDGDFQVLSEIDDQVDLEFSLPPLEKGLARTAFFHSHGYYQAHQPLNANKSLVTLKSIVDQPGGLADFSLGIYRRYHEIAQAAPRRPAARQESY